MKADSPCFLWWPKDFLADANVQRMTWEERGIYRHLLDLCWLEGGVEASLANFRRMFGVSQGKAQALLNVFSECFLEDEDSRPPWWTHKRIEKEREAQNAKRSRASRRGKAGAQARWK